MRSHDLPPSLPRPRGRLTPVFLDPRGWRRRAANLALGLAAIALVITFAVIGTGVLIGPRASIPPRQLEATRDTTMRPPLPNPGVAIKLTAAQYRQLPSGASHTLRMAYLSTEENASSLLSLRQHIGVIDAVIADWLRLDGPERDFQLHVEEAARLDIPWLRHNAPQLKVYPELSDELSHDEWFALLVSASLQARVVGEITNYLRTYDFPGAVLDIRNVPVANAPQLVLFVEQLAKRLKGDGRKTLLLVAPDISKRVAQAAASPVDYVIAATENEYDEKRPNGAPVAQGWFEDRLYHLISAVPPSKLILSIGSYGFDTDEFGNPRIISVQRAWDILASKGGHLVLDGSSLDATFAYHDAKGQPHRVWVLDAATAFNHARAALAVGPAGLALWHLGMEDPGVWHVLGRGLLPTEQALKALKVAEPGYGTYGGLNGALLFARPGFAGKRTLTYNAPLGLVIAEDLTKVPRQAQPLVWQSRDPKAVALTFDDGPDPRYTGKILDILARKHVKASFFVIGRNAFAYPDLIKRIYTDGHDVGNHTLTHPDPLAISRERLALELNANTRIVASLIGIHMHLFRPPYAAPDFTYLDARPEVVQTASRLGYLITELGADSCDYCFMGPDWIVRDVMTGVVDGNRHIVLMHDSGGNRDAMITALPRLIDALRVAGYHFVTIHQLVGLPRSAVMEKVSFGAAGNVWRMTIAVFGGISDAIPGVAITTAVLGILRLLAIAVLAAVQTYRARRAPQPAPYHGSIAVLVPAFNEEAVICNTVRCILSSTITDRIEVIVIDDGSSDATSEVVLREFGSDPRLTVSRKTNGGKASALNWGLGCTTAEVIVTIDGDTVLLPDAIERLTARFGDPRVGAAAGNVLVGNQVTLMTRFQALEYVTSQNLDRRAFELFNAIGVVPGAIGAWRREALMQVGGYANDTLAEDAELTVSLQRHDWRIVSEPSAKALTEAPETLRGFLKQRFRWMFGMLQVAYKHAGSLLERPRGVSLLTIPNIFVFQFGFTLLAPVMDMVLLWTVMTSASAWLFGTPSGEDATLLLIAQYWLVFQTIDLLAAVLGIALDRGGCSQRLAALVLLQRFSYRQLLYVTAIRALLAALRGTFVGWGKLLRTGNVVVRFRA